MAEVLLYHLQIHPLERVLPQLIERTLERGWRAVVQASSRERVEALDTLLWTFREDSFLPHGTARDGHPELQAVWLTTGADNPNGAQVRFLVDGADLADAAGHLRLVHLFDGRDEEAVAGARTRWKAAKAAGHTLAYWQQDEGGKWQRRV
jgi:DNA polymerase-3 subunit chi